VCGNEHQVSTMGAATASCTFLPAPTCIHELRAHIKCIKCALGSNIGDAAAFSHRSVCICTLRNELNFMRIAE